MNKNEPNTSSSNVFDPFDVFDGVEEEKSAKAKGGESNPWSDSTWSGATSDLMMRADCAETSFDMNSVSPSAFQFDVTTTNTGSMSIAASATSENFPGYNPFAAPAASSAPTSSNNRSTTDMLFPSDPMATLSGEELTLDTAETTVRLTVREQFSTVYDDAGSPPSCYLEGSIFVQPTALAFSDSTSTDNNNNNKTSFCVVVQDPSSNIDQMEEVHTISSNITTAADRQELQTVFRVTLPSQSQSQQSSHNNNSLTTAEVPVASYTCNPQLRPIPMLVKSRVQVTDDVSRVGFKVRANPSNAEALKNLVILIAVPPFVQGETVKMSRKGGVWDEMKRTIIWNVKKLEPGEVLEIQAQFQSGKKQNLAHVDLQFPVLVRADVPRLFSGLNVSTDYQSQTQESESQSQSQSLAPVKSNVSHCTRILHRKV